ncbi:MAG: S8 family peptidase [Deltaproteobacteria bacterium]|nr:S8 family peptidase [Deltaproteobacteria bacterium]
MRLDLDANLVNATTEVAPGDPVEAGILTKRVLVRLAAAQRPDSMKDLHWVHISGDIYAVDVPLLKLEEMAAAPEVEYVEAGRRLAPTLDSSVAETRADRVRAGVDGLSGAGVLVGIIDFGFDFTLDDFRDANGDSRVAFLWDQNLTAAAGEAAPARFGYGVEYDRAAIDAALGSVDPFAVVRHRPGAESHGTHVAGTAVGNGSTSDGDFAAGAFVGVAPESTIVFVQPNSSDVDSSFTDSVHVAEAIAYVFEKADELGLPCVINMSLGQNGGSHDGESVVERAIDRFLGRPGRAMCVAAGNEHIWRGHAGGSLALGETRELHWKFGGELPLPGGGVLQPGFGDFTPNEMEIWYSSRDVFRFRLTDPDGNATAFLDPGTTEVHTFPSGDEAFIDSERFTVLNGDARIYIEISPGPGQSRVKTGEWRVELEAVESRDGRFDAWIERDARRSQNRFADQSFFLGTDFDGIKTLGTPATTRRGIAVANYDHQTQSPSDSSSRGPTRLLRQKPEVAAPGTNIVSSASLAGRPNPGSPAGTDLVPARTSMSGTSMASPHVAGIAALMLERNPRLSSEQIRKLLIASASPPAGVTPFDNAWGFGRVDAEAAVALL